MEHIDKIMPDGSILKVEKSSFVSAYDGYSDDSAMARFIRIIGILLFANLLFTAYIYFELEDDTDISFSELYILFLSLAGSGWFLIGWYGALGSAWPKDKCVGARRTLRAMPAAAFIIILAILVTIAAPSVAMSPFWIFYYTVLGFAWTGIGMYLSHYCFDVSWRDDVINQNRNEPALFPVTGCFVGLALIYSGANIGDGPGWWCVLFAAGLGTGAWLILGHAVQRVTGAFDTVTIGRDTPCGIRMGFYLAASGLVLGKASSGDWTSLFATVIEFLIGWYVLPLTIVVIFVERYYAKKRAEKMAVSAAVLFKSENEPAGNENLWAVAWGLAYMAIAAVTVLGVHLWK